MACSFMEAPRHYREGIRYYLASKKVEEEFQRWMSIPSTIQLVNKLLEDCKRPNFAAVVRCT